MPNRMEVTESVQPFKIQPFQTMYLNVNANHTNICIYIQTDATFWSETNKLTSQNITEFTQFIANTNCSVQLFSRQK